MLTIINNSNIEDMKITRKEFYKELNTATLKVFRDCGEYVMLLTEVRDELRKNDYIQDLYYNKLNNGWRFTDYYDRFVNNIKHCENFKIVKKRSRYYLAVENLNYKTPE